MRITNKSTGQRPLGVYRGPNIINPAVEKQKAEALVGNTDVRHFNCISCNLPFSQSMPPGSEKHQSKIICPNCYTEQVG